jgi:hypothetical protein
MKCGHLIKVSAPRCKVARNLQAEDAVRRFKTTFKILLVAIVMLSAAGTPVIARPMVSGQHARVERVQKKQQSSFFLSWMKNWRAKLSRYAMAAS